MKRYKKRIEQRIVRKSRKIIVKLPWDEAVNVLTVALGEAIWREGGNRDDMIATADIVHHAICLGINDIADLRDRKKPLNVVPFRRKRSYLR